MQNLIKMQKTLIGRKIWDRICLTIAFLLPRDIVYFAFMRVVGEAHKFEATAQVNWALADIAESWEKQNA